MRKLSQRIRRLEELLVERGGSCRSEAEVTEAGDVGAFGDRAPATREAAAKEVELGPRLMHPARWTSSIC